MVLRGRTISRTLASERHDREGHCLGVHDDDILDFDFVEDATGETPGASRPVPPAPPRMGGDEPPRGPGRPGLDSRHLTPLLRLVGVVGLAIALIVLLALWAEGCAGEDDQAAYTDYVESIGAIGADSAKIGDDLATLLTTAGLEQAELETKLGGLLQQQQLDVQRATELGAPGAAFPAHEYAVQALELRASGLQGLLTVFRATKDAKDASVAGERLASQARRLTASDVVWNDLFQSGLVASAEESGVEVAAPVSVFVENPDLYSPSSMSAIWQRIHGASTGGTPTGLHGSGLAFTKATPSGVQLSTETETTITVSTDLGFEVGVTNTGEEQEVQVQVTLTIPKQPNPIVKKGTIDLIDPGETKTVVFSDFPDVPFGEGTTIQVSIEPVAGETNTANNSAEYPVVFTLTP